MKLIFHILADIHKSQVVARPGWICSKCFKVLRRQYLNNLRFPLLLLLLLLLLLFNEALTFQ